MSEHPPISIIDIGEARDFLSEIRFSLMADFTITSKEIIEHFEVEEHQVDLIAQSLKNYGIMTADVDAQPNVTKQVLVIAAATPPHIEDFQLKAIIGAFFKCHYCSELHRHLRTTDVEVKDESSWTAVSDEVKKLFTHLDETEANTVAQVYVDGMLFMVPHYKRVTAYETRPNVSIKEILDFEAYCDEAQIDGNKRYHPEFIASAFDCSTPRAQKILETAKGFISSLDDKENWELLVDLHGKPSLTHEEFETYRELNLEVFHGNKFLSYVNGMADEIECGVTPTHDYIYRVIKYIYPNLRAAAARYADAFVETLEMVNSRRPVEIEPDFDSGDDDDGEDDKRKMSVRIPADLKKRLEIHAVKNDTTLTYVMGQSYGLYLLFIGTDDYYRDNYHMSVSSETNPTSSESEKEVVVVNARHMSSRVLKDIKLAAIKHDLTFQRISELAFEHYLKAQIPLEERGTSKMTNRGDDEMTNTPEEEVETRQAAAMAAFAEDDEDCGFDDEFEEDFEVDDEDFNEEPIVASDEDVKSDYMSKLFIDETETCNYPPEIVSSVLHEVSERRREFLRGCDSMEELQKQSVIFNAQQSILEEVIVKMNATG